MTTLTYILRPQQRGGESPHSPPRLSPAIGTLILDGFCSFPQVRREDFQSLPSAFAVAAAAASCRQAGRIADVQLIRCNVTIFLQKNGSADGFQVAQFSGSSAFHLT
jgi:hypothetical protein